MARILFVEDELYYNDRYLKFLRDDLHHEVDTAEDGSSAIVSLETKEYDLLILDIMMPQGDIIGDKVNGSQTGIEVLSRLRNRKIVHSDPQIPVIIFSAVAERTDLQKIKQLGIYHFFRKPVDLMEFKNVIQGLFDKENRDGEA